MDADDLSLPQRFERQVAYLNEHPECVLVGSQVLLIDTEGAPIRVKGDTQFHHEQIDHAHMNRTWPLVHPTIMVRRSALDAVGGYREKYKWLEDLDLFLRLAEVGKLANLEDVLLHYRLHMSSVCHTHREEQGNRGDRGGGEHDPEFSSAHVPIPGDSSILLLCKGPADMENGDPLHLGAARNF